MSILASVPKLQKQNQLLWWSLLPCSDESFFPRSLLKGNTRHYSWCLYYAIRGSPVHYHTAPRRVFLQSWVFTYSLSGPGGGFSELASVVHFSNSLRRQELDTSQGQNILGSRDRSFPSRSLAHLRLGSTRGQSWVNEFTSCSEEGIEIISSLLPVYLSRIVQSKWIVA